MGLLTGIGNEWIISANVPRLPQQPGPCTHRQDSAVYFWATLMQAMMLKYWVHLDNVLCKSQQQAAFADPFVNADTNTEPSQRPANAHLLPSKCYVTTVQHVNDQNCKHTYRRQSTSQCTLQFGFLPYPDLVGVFMFAVLEYKKDASSQGFLNTYLSNALRKRYDVCFRSHHPSHREHDEQV